ncbi:MAG: O-antigen ligase family protein [Symploca sp. SIO2D2]|nr:O-antigen ligase family protein [Symploca sp. SIO2D2]
MVSGFRLPTQAITLSDANGSAAIRQITFAGAGLIALVRLFCCQALGSTLVARLPFILFTSFLVASFSWSESPTLTLKRVAIFAFGIIAQITVIHSSRRPVEAMIKTVVYFTMAVALVSIALHIALPAQHTVNPARPGLAGISNHPNTFAPFASIGLILSLGLRTSNRRQQWIKLGGQALLALALVLTTSITAWAATLVCIALYVFFVSTAYRRGLFQLIALSVVTLVLIIGWSNVKRGLFDAAGRDESLSGRDALWEIVGKKASEQSLIGHGFGAFWTEGKGRELVQTWNPRQSHNAYLDVFVDLGSIGLLATLAVFPLGILMAWPSVSGKVNTPQRKAVSAMGATAFGYLITYGMSQSYLLRYDMFAFFILVWITLLMTNPDSNRIQKEFAS